MARPSQVPDARPYPAPPSRRAATARNGYGEALVSKPTFVGYRRVSTKQQGVSGLGLEAQERMVAEHVAVSGGVIIAHFTEVETGKRSDRPELRKALALARKKKATLIVAKLDRLARNVAFVSQLMDSGVDFVAADFPEANRFMIHILAAVAEYEAKMISDRTKAGLASRRARGFALGNIKNLKRGGSPAPELNKAKARADAERMRPIVDHLRSEGITSERGICDTLNDRGYVTGRGLAWHRMTVRRLLGRLEINHSPPPPGPGPLALQAPAGGTRDT